MGKSLVSCIVPMYNSQRTICECLQSIVKIDYSPLEVLIVDDGSTDQSLEIVQEFISKEKHPGIEFSILAHQNNMGISSAKSLGMSKMRGDFFFFSGADDLNYPNRVSLPLSYLLDNSGVDIVYSDIDLWHEAKGRDAVVKRGFPAGMTNENAFLYQLHRSHLWSGVLFARSSAKLDFDESLSSAVDYDWYFNQYFHGRTIHFIDQPLARYRLHDSNTSKKLSKSQGNVERILKKYDFEEAYSRMLSQNDADDLHLAFASVNLTLGQFELALEKLETVREDSFGKGFITGVVHASMGNHELAAEIFRSLYDRFPEHPECLNNLAVCLVHIDRSLDEAASLIQLAREKNPDYLDARHNQSLLKTDSFDVGQLILTFKPLRPNLTHLDKYN